MRSQEKEKVVREWIAAKVPGYRCAFCGGEDMNIGDVWAMPQAAVLLPGGQVTPLVPVICKTCARVDLFSAIDIGI